jgi:sugar phosphate permease
MSLMIFIITINYIDRGALAYAQESIIEMFDINPQDWGWILGFFGYGYLVGTLFGGTIADKKGSKFVWIIAVTSWSIFAIATAWAGEIGIYLLGGSAVAGFGLCRIIFGLFEGPVYATMNKTIADWVPRKDRAIFVGFGLIGTPLGAMLTAPIAVGILSITDWRMMYIILGVVGILWAIVWNKIFTSLPEDNPRVSKEELAEIRSDENELVKTQTEAKSTPIPWYAFFKNPSLLLNAASFFAYNYVNFLILTWTPKYLQDAFGFQLSSLWYLGMVPWIGAVFTTAFGGKISTVLFEKTGSFRIARTGLVMVCLFLTAGCFFVIPYMSSVTAILLLMMVGNAINSLPQSVYWSNVMDAAPSKVGTFSGITHFIINTASFIAPILTGILVVNYGYSAMFNAAAIIAFIGMITMFFVKPSKMGEKVNKSEEIMA